MPGEGWGGQGGGGRFLMDLSGSGLNLVEGRELRAESGAVTEPRLSEGEALTPLPAPRWGQRSAALGPEPPAPCPSRDGSTLHGEAHFASLLLPTAFFPLLPSIGSLSFAKIILESGVC